VPRILESVSPIDATVKAQQVLHGGPAIVLAFGTVIGATTYGLRNMRRLRLRAIRRRRRRERKEERLRNEERAREWAIQRADVLAEVRRMLEGDFLPRLERKLRDEFLQSLDLQMADEGLPAEQAFDDDAPDKEGSTVEFAAHALQFANDFPFPFDRKLPHADQPVMPVPNNVVPPAGKAVDGNPPANGNANQAP
jgi:hypothetical protein